MGEKAHLPHENGMNNDHNESASDSDHEMAEQENGENEFEDMTSEEFQMLDSQLDALNSALDDIEQKNDDIHAQLLQLLQSNRDIRKQMQESNSSPVADVSGGEDQPQSENQ